MKNNQQTVGFLRLIGSIFYDSLLLTAVLFFATFALLLIPQQLQHAGPYLELAKLAWYVFVSYCYFAGFWYKGRQRYAGRQGDYETGNTAIFLSDTVVAAGWTGFSLATDRPEQL